MAALAGVAESVSAAGSEASSVEAASTVSSISAQTRKDLAYSAVSLVMFNLKHGEQSSHRIVSK